MRLKLISKGFISYCDIFLLFLLVRCVVLVVRPLKTFFCAACNSNMSLLARLNSCLDQMREVLAESVTEQTMVQAVLDSKFDVQKALDLVLSQSSKKNVKTKNENAVIVGNTTKGILLFNCLHLK